MKFLHYINTGSPIVNAKIMNAIKKVMNGFDFCFEETGYAIVELGPTGSEEPFYAITAVQNNSDDEEETELTVSPEATAKMLMLRTNEWILSTGIVGNALDSLDIIVGETLANGRMSNEVFASVNEEINNPDTRHLDDLSDECWDLLRKHGITRKAGGIRLPYKTHVTVHDPNNKPEVIPSESEIRVVVDGAAKDSIDEMLAFYILAHIQEVMKEEWKNDCIEFDISDMEEEPSLRAWLTLFGITKD